MYDFCFLHFIAVLNSVTLLWLPTCCYIYSRKEQTKKHEDLFILMKIGINNKQKY